MKKSIKWILLGLVLFYFWFSWMVADSNYRCKRAYEEFPIFTIFCPPEEEVQTNPIPWEDH